MRGVGWPWSRSFVSDGAAVHEHAEAAVACSIERDFHSGQPGERAYVGGRWPCRAKARKGWLRYARGSPPGGHRAVLHVPYFCTLLADVCNHLGHSEDGLQALAEAHTLVEHEERYREAEVCRLLGRLALAQPGTSQGGRSPVAAGTDRRLPPGGEIIDSAAMSLACLWQQQWAGAEARDLSWYRFLWLVHRGL